jgi:hypothetical protein
LETSLPFAAQAFSSRLSSLRTVTAPPPSTTDTHWGAKCVLKSTLPLATASLISALDAPSTYRISVKKAAAGLDD